MDGLSATKDLNLQGFRLKITIRWCGVDLEQGTFLVEKLLIIEDRGSQKPNSARNLVMKSSVPLFSNKGKVICLIIVFLPLGFIFWDVSNPPQRPKTTRAVTPYLDSDPGCKAIVGRRTKDGCFVAKSAEEAGAVFDIQNRREGGSIAQLQFNGRIKWLATGTRIEEVGPVRGFEITKIRPSGDSNLWFCAVSNIGLCE